jgi:toxin ParE1/3/4
MEVLDHIGSINPSAAERLFERIEHDLEHVAEHPYLYKASQRVAGLREIVTHPNYIIYYRVTASCIEVVNVIHTRREFPVHE